MELFKTITVLQKDVNKYYDKAKERSSDPEKMHLEVSKSNGIHKTIGEKRRAWQALWWGSFELE